LPFLLSVAIFGVIVFLNFRSMLQANLNFAQTLKDTLLYPGIAVALVVSGLYFLKILPPIPISIQHIGIYHKIEKLPADAITGESQFVLKYDRPFWKFWQSGAQDFVAYSDDRIYCFARIFSPSNFNDEIYFHWQKKSSKGWETSDRVANAIKGGRDQGFRGYAFKANFDSGLWRVKIETRDGREIGRIDFEVEQIKTPPPDQREFKQDTH